MKQASNKLIIYKCVVGPFQANSFILSCASTKEAIIIDPGDNTGQIHDTIKEKGLLVKKILLTHAHLDHCAHAGVLAGKLRKSGLTPEELTLYMHKEERWLYDNLALQGKTFGIPIPDKRCSVSFMEDNEEIRISAEHLLKAILVPGHSPGSLCFLSKEQNFLIAGDVLFRGSIGRTDLWKGDMNQLVQTIKDKLFTLDEKTNVLPGHGDGTTIGKEKRGNPLLS